MITEEREESLKTLQDIRGMMERSTRFISLSGWSGVWAGSVALIGCLIARTWLNDLPAGYYQPYRNAPVSGIGDYPAIVTRFVALAICILVVALIGGYYFTMRKAKKNGGSVWNTASRRMLVEIAIPMAAGGIFAFAFLLHQHEGYIAPICLAFYGLALINGSKHTLSDIKYLGTCEVVLGCISLLFPGMGLTFWALGFGVLHIVYGIFMWNKYDKRTDKALV